MNGRRAQPGTVRGGLFKHPLGRVAGFVSREPATALHALQGQRPFLAWYRQHDAKKGPPSTKPTREGRACRTPRMESPGSKALPLEKHQGHPRAGAQKQGSHTKKHSHVWHQGARGGHSVHRSYTRRAPLATNLGV